MDDVIYAQYLSMVQDTTSAQSVSTKRSVNNSAPPYQDIARAEQLRKRVLGLESSSGDIGKRLKQAPVTVSPVDIADISAPKIVRAADRARAAMSSSQGTLTPSSAGTTKVKTRLNGKHLLTWSVVKSDICSKVRVSVFNMARIVNAPNIF
jgi:hypothetical protein